LLNRGEKLTELLKQKQYVPMTAEEQVCILYAGVRGYLDKVQTSELSKCEAGFLKDLHNKHSHILDTIKKEGELSDASDNALKAILQDYIPAAGLKMK